MASISSLGIGSGLDINSLVSELVASERAPREARLTRTDARLTTEFTALATLKGALGTLQTSVNALKGVDSFAVRKVTSGDEQYFTATASGSAVAGAYAVEVQQLATAARLGSAAYAAGADGAIGTGTLSIAVGTRTIEVEITSENDSLAQIRDAINAAPGNNLARATLVRDATGSYLVLSGVATGAENAITVSASGADAGLQQLVSDLNAIDPVRDVVAQDAIAMVSGYEIRSPRNVISGAIDGVTLNLKKASPDGETTSLTVERDDAAIQKKAESFVAAYNTLAQQMAALGKYDAATETAGPLLGDSLLRGIETQLRRMIGDPVAGTTGDYRTLSSIGISMSVTGTLTLDSARFTAALSADPEAVNRVFSSESGVASRMSSYLDERLAFTGEIASRNVRISDQRKQLDKDRDALDARMLVVQQRYLKQFTAMDTMLSQLQGTSSYLSQQLDSLANLSNGGRK